MTRAVGGFETEEVVVQSHEIGSLSRKGRGDLRGGLGRGDQSRMTPLRTAGGSIWRERNVFVGENRISGYTAKVIRPDQMVS